MKSLDLIQSSFSTILLDAIQFFPQEVPKSHAESHGLLFGIEYEEGMPECDHVFPVGNVRSRSKDGVGPKKGIDQAIQNAKGILSTSLFLGTYHSHPNDEYFEGWAGPSNMDVGYLTGGKIPCEIIIALARNEVLESKLFVQYEIDEACLYRFNETADGHGWPTANRLGHDIHFIKGKFMKYNFEMRAYYVDKQGMTNIDLFSSEAEVLMNLLAENIDIGSLGSELTYRTRKLEYDFRYANKRDAKKLEKIMQNADYHMLKLKEAIEHVDK